MGLKPKNTLSQSPLALASGTIVEDSSNSQHPSLNSPYKETLSVGLSQQKSPN
jgi:hypothetical protein